MGPVQISHDDQPIQIRGHQPLALLAYLLVTGKVHTRLQARLEAELPLEVIATAKARAKNRTLAEVVAEILPPTYN